MDQLSKTGKLTIKNICSKDNFESGNHKCRLNEKMLKEFLQNIKYDFVFICSSASLLSDFSGRKIDANDQGELTGILKKLGFTKENVLNFNFTFKYYYRSKKIFYIEVRKYFT